ncbi:hypothetical protein NDA18_006295 [Ustilago nuda]|nr:hypothetical protein NDA18_006295 [Ustilago nuda]
MEAKPPYHAAPTPSPIGGRSFIDHAKLRILLAPVAGISESDFARWCDYVRSFETIRLADLPSSCSARRRTANAGPSSGSSSSSSSSSSPILHKGEVHLSFLTSYDPDHSFLAPFNMHRQVLGVLGLATYSSNALNKHQLETAPSALRELHPGALVHRVFGFDSAAKRPETVDLSSIKDVVAARLNAGKRPSSPLASTPATEQDLTNDGLNGQADSLPSPQLSTSPDTSGFSAHKDGGLTIFPAVRKDGKDIRFYLKTLLADLVASILDGLDHIVTGLDGTPLETPRETLDGLAPNRNSSSATSSASTSSWSSKTNTAATGSLAAGMGAAASRASSLFGAFSSSSTGDVGMGTTTPTSSRPSSAIGGRSHPFELASPGSGTSSPTLENTTRSKILLANANKKSAKRVTSAAGTGTTGTGRYAKVKADLHLLSGNLWDALEGYSTALAALGKERALAGGQDAVWFASALEGFAVARVLVSRMGGVVLEKAPCFDLPWSNLTGKEKEKEKEKDGIARPYAKQAWGEIAEAYTIAVIIYSKCLAPPSVLLEPVRSVTNDSPRDYTHPLIHASACTQYARFLLAVWASGGWNGECFDQLVYGGVPPALAEEKLTNAMYLSFTAVSGIARHDIAAAASSALSHSIVALKATDQITLLSTLTAIFGCIGFSRREAHLLRQLQSMIVGLLFKAKKVTARPPNTSSFPIEQEEQFGKEAGKLVGNIVAQTSFDSLGRGPEAVLVLAMQICETYGIHVEVDPLGNIPPYHILSKASEGLRSAYASPTLGGSEDWKPAANNPAPTLGPALLTPLEIASEPPFGWKEQQISLLKETISIAELLSDYVGMAFFGAILLRDFHQLLEAEEQRDLMIGIQRAVQAARWAGAQDLAVKYWGPPEPLCSLELLPLAPEKMPLERDAKLLHSDTTAGGKGKQGVAGLNNPFFWNPSGGAASKNKVITVQNEAIHVMATLQNPFAVDLHVDTIKLVGEGAVFVPEEAERVSIPPYSFQTVRLAGTAKEVGKVTIKGITLTLAGGCTEEQTFHLPLYDDENAKRRRKVAAENDDRRTRLKVMGLDARGSLLKQKSGTSADGDAKAATGKYLEVNVVTAQPMLAAYCHELDPTGGVDIFEGETQTIHLELLNLSNELDVNFVRLSFSDDASEAAKQALIEGELLPQDVHEIEWDLLHQPCMAQAGGQPQQLAMRIEPAASTIIPIQVRGKIGCMQAKVTVEYAHVEWDKVRAGISGTNFYVRTLEVGFGMTVHPVVVCRGFSIAPLKAAEAARLTQECLASADRVPAGLKVVRSEAADSGKSENPLSVTPEAQADESEYRLLTLSLSNVHREDILLRLTLNTGGVVPLHLYRILQAGSTSKVTLPQPRIELDPATGRPFAPSSNASPTIGDGMFPPIPSNKEANNRQFIVSKIQLSKEEEKEARKQFWYRQALLERLDGLWRTLPSSALFSLSGLGGGDGEDVVRYGKVPLRGLVSGGGIILDDASLPYLRKDAMHLTLTFNESNPIHAQDFITITARLGNKLTRPIKPLIRLVPTSPSGAQDPALIEQVIIADGTFTAPRRGPSLARGEEREVQWQVTFLSPGKFAFLVIAHEAVPGEDGESFSNVSPLQTVVVLPSM